ncbi:MAG: hypothetical protein LUH51_02570 [Firmicutes bacterium]|nr:hypothetical protein [Bacillota bacterium]
MRTFVKRALGLLSAAVLMAGLLPLAQASNPYNYPDYMMNNATLRALEYTGYDVQYLKDKGYLYLKEYVAKYILQDESDKSTCKTNDEGEMILSNIGYSYTLMGDETVSDSSTVTGLAPDIAKFEKYGLCCASFVGYYIFNYLPNIEGVDTSTVVNAVKKYSAYTTGSGATDYNLAYPVNWMNALDYLAKSSSTSGVTKYTDESTAYDHLVPGDIIIFHNGSVYSHIAIYAGEGTMYNADGTVAMETCHYIIHVGNSRGPEISFVEAFYDSSYDSGYADGSSTASKPVAFYHIEYPNSTAQIAACVTDVDGYALAGAYFTAVNASTGASYSIGPTDSTGYAISSQLPFGTYTVTETTVPDGYQASGQSSWTVTLNTLFQISTIEAVNDAEEEDEYTPAITSVYANKDGATASQTRVKISWTAVDGADGYQIFRSTSKNGTYTCIKTISDGSTSSYTNSGLTLGQTYYYKVRAYTKDSSGSWVYSDFSRVKYTPACATFTSVYANATDRVRLLWNAVDGAEGYQIWRADSADGEYKIVKTITSGDTTAYSNNGLEIGQTYYYKIRAYATVNGQKVFGAYSDVSAVTTLYIGSTTMTAASYSTGIAKLAWNAVDGAEGYQIWRADSEDGTYSIVKTITSGSTTSYSNNGLTSGKTYYYKIRAYSVVDGSRTYGGYSTVVSVTAK